MEKMTLIDLEAEGYVFIIQSRAYRVFLQREFSYGLTLIAHHAFIKSRRNLQQMAIDVASIDFVKRRLQGETFE